MGSQYFLRFLLLQIFSYIGLLQEQLQNTGKLFELVSNVDKKIEENRKYYVNLMGLIREFDERAMRADDQYFFGFQMRDWLTEVKSLCLKENCFSVDKCFFPIIINGAKANHSNTNNNRFRILRGGGSSDNSISSSWEGGDGKWGIDITDNKLELGYHFQCSSDYQKRERDLSLYDCFLPWQLLHVDFIEVYQVISNESIKSFSKIIELYKNNKFILASNTLKSVSNYYLRKIIEKPYWFIRNQSFIQLAKILNSSSNLNKPYNELCNNEIFENFKEYVNIFNFLDFLSNPAVQPKYLTNKLSEVLKKIRNETFVLDVLDNITLSIKEKFEYMNTSVCKLENYFREILNFNNCLAKENPNKFENFLAADLKGQFCYKLVYSVGESYKINYSYLSSPLMDFDPASNKSYLLSKNYKLDFTDYDSLLNFTSIEKKTPNDKNISLAEILNGGWLFDLYYNFYLFVLIFTMILT